MRAGVLHVRLSLFPSFPVVQSLFSDHQDPMRFYEAVLFISWAITF